MSIYEQMAGAKVQGRGVKIKEAGEFLIRVDKVKEQPSNQGFGTLWVVEFTIVEGTIDNPPGAERSWVQRPETRAQTDLGNIKAFLAALERIQDANSHPWTADVFQNAVSDAQPYAGRLLRLSTEVITTKANFEFTVHTWAPPRDDDDDSPAPQAPAGEAAPPPPPPGAGVPEPPLTQEAWAAGAGPAIVNPNATDYEYHPQHPEWGNRPRKS